MSKSSVRDRFRGGCSHTSWAPGSRGLDVYLPNAQSVAVPPHEQQLVVSLLNHTSENSTQEPCCLCIMATIWGELNILSHQLQRSRETLLSHCYFCFRLRWPHLSQENGSQDQPRSAVCMFVFDAVRKADLKNPVFDTIKTLATEKWPAGLRSSSEHWQLCSRGTRISH